MHELVPENLRIVGVSLRSESGQPLFVQVNPQWIVTGDRYIHPHVELLAVYEQRSIDVSGNDGIFSLLKLLASLEYSDAATTARICRFDDEELLLISLLFFYLVELICLLRKNP